jgi:hypothetical protein
MAALKESMQAKGRAKVRKAVRKRVGKPTKEEEPRPRACQAGVLKLSATGACYHYVPVIAGACAFPS